MPTILIMTVTVTSQSKKHKQKKIMHEITGTTSVLLINYPDYIFLGII